MAFDLIDIARQHVETRIAPARARQRPRPDEISTTSHAMLRPDVPRDAPPGHPTC